MAWTETPIILSVLDEDNLAPQEVRLRNLHDLVVDGLVAAGFREGVNNYGLTSVALE